LEVLPEKVLGGGPLLAMIVVDELAVVVAVEASVPVTEEVVAAAGAG